MAGRDTSATTAVTFVGGFGTRFFETVSQDGVQVRNPDSDSEV
jgi:hypothetical protein